MDIQKLKQKLEKELAEVEEELTGIGEKHSFKNGDKPVDWEGKPADFSTDAADESEVADKIEEYEENTAVVKELETKYNDIRGALNKIEKSNYGFCEICNQNIEEDRLEANPAAKTCKNHMN